jgi:prophage DNA circulation protein
MCYFEENQFLSLNSSDGGSFMSRSLSSETMLRKPILMPPSMIAKVNKIAEGRKVSFAKVVREAVAAFNPESSDDDDAMLEALAETMIETTRDVVTRISEIEKRLDETHALLEAHHGRQ